MAPRLYSYQQKPDTRVAASAEPLIEKLRNTEYSVLVGRNNCGKSWLLKSFATQWGDQTSYLGPARYQNFNLLSYFTPTRGSRRAQRHKNFLSQWQNEHQNIDNSPVNLQQSIAELSDSQRDKLTEIIKLLLSFELEIKYTAENNRMSQQYISVGGHNLSYTSSGFRLIMTLVTSLLDEEYATYLIDEPELGISPEAQGLLADFLFDREHRAKYFSHIKTLILATHSTIFLDRKEISNNYYVQKEGDEVSIAQVTSQAEFNRIHFFLLGNRFETLYLPSVIVLVEGKTDHAFVERALTLAFPNTQLSVIQGNSDDRIKEVLKIASGLLTDIQRSPYRDRIFVILDAVHSASLPAELVAMGVMPENIVKWPRNGIEYYYPPAIVDSIFGAGPEITIDGDAVSRNGVSYKKADLATKVAAKLDGSTAHHGDFTRLVLAPLRSKVL